MAIMDRNDHQQNSAYVNANVQDSWPYMVDKCNGISDKIAVWIVLHRYHADIPESIGFAYKPGWTPRSEQIVDGNRWISDQDAYNMWNSQPNDQKGGLEWGNNVASFCYGSSNNWTINGQSYIYTDGTGRRQGWDALYVPVGTTVRWDHDLRNEGPTAIKSLHSTIDRKDYEPGGNDINKKYVMQSFPNADFSNVGTGIFYKYYGGEDYFTIPYDKAGWRFCQRVAWLPGSSSNGGWAWSRGGDGSWETGGYACAIAYSDFSLSPHAKIGTSNGVQPLVYGKPVRPTEYVHNSSQSKADMESNYMVSQFVLNSNNLPDQMNLIFSHSTDQGRYAESPIGAGKDLCRDWMKPYWIFTGITCEWTHSGKRTFDGMPNTNLDSEYDNPEIKSNNYKPGDVVCRIVAVSPYKHPIDAGGRVDTATRTSWRVSEPACVRIVSRPLMQVWGNDTRVGSAGLGNSATNAIVRGSMGKIGGSWGEYGVYAPTSATGNHATVEQFGSGAGLSADGSPDAPAAWSKLTFANDTLNGNFAAPASMGRLPNVGQYLQQTGAKAGLSVLNQKGDVTVGQYVGNRILLVDGTVTIDSSITGQSKVANDKGIQQMVIVAKKINIKSNVSRVDAWLVSSGSIDTCSDKTGALTTGSGPNSCDTPLTITGAIMAQKVLPRRTGGGGDDATPAETYNLRSDAYLWAHNVAQASNTLRTVYTQELPPRY